MLDVEKIEGLREQARFRLMESYGYLERIALALAQAEPEVGDYIYFRERDSLRETMQTIEDTLDDSIFTMSISDNSQC